MEKDEGKKRPEEPRDFPNDLGSPFGNAPEDLGRRDEPNPMPPSMGAHESIDRPPLKGGLGARFAAAVSTNPDGKTSSLDMDAFSKQLMSASDPLSTLYDFMADVQARQGGQKAGTLPPSNLELFLLQELEDAGIGPGSTSEVPLPRFKVVRPVTSRMFYLRISDHELPYASKLAIYKVEAALNAALLATLYFDDANSEPVEELTRLKGRVMASITSQLPSIDERLSLEDELRRDSEWTVRKTISIGVECAQLPYRLQTTYRTNVAWGNVAFVCELMPAQVMPEHSWVAGAGVVPTTFDMRNRMAADYALRIGLFLAACAFRSSEKIKRVWVAGIIDTAQSHTCYYSVCFDRERFGKIPLSGAYDPVEVYRRFGAELDEHAGALHPVTQSFSLEDERFCPARRYDPIELSDRELDEPASMALGVPYVRNLGCDESRRRADVATKIVRQLGDSTEQNVRTILSIAGDDPDPTVQRAAKRCVSELIDGTLDDNDPLALENEFVSGDKLSKALDQSEKLLAAYRENDAFDTLEAALDPIEKSGKYLDYGLTEWRSFENYVDRALYNRLLWSGTSEIKLAPTGYLDALLMSSSLAAMSGDAELAIRRARRAVEVAPMSSNSRVQLARMLYMYQDASGARDTLNEMLLLAHSAEGLAYGYYGMALLSLNESDLQAARACYQKASGFVPLVVSPTSPNAQQIRELGDSRMSASEISATLSSRGIVEAPTQQVSRVFEECMRAAMDAELFPIARQFVKMFDEVTRDDVTFSILRSIEDAPDR